jgi:hypothetical protein
VTTQDMVSRLLVHWANAGAEPNGGVGEEELRSFQEKYDVQVPDDLRGYFLKVNGMVQDCMHDQDGNGFTFWPLSRLRPVEVSFPGVSPEAKDPQFFIFADYLSSSWEYAIGLWREEREGNPVLYVDPTIRLVAASFREFVDLCLDDSPKLYLPPKTKK